MRIFYDTEFIERGHGQPIDLISIGMINEVGGSYYAINASAPWDEIYANPWLRDNVLAQLPRDEQHTEEWRPLYDHPDVKSPGTIEAEVGLFCRTAGLVQGVLVEVDTPCELWAWYADYDHVVLAQLFGKMIDLPPWIPMYTRVLKQAADMLVPDLRLKQSEDAAHNALFDAVWVKQSYTTVRREVLVRYGRDILGGEFVGGPTNLA